jgi:hypothetical protein
MALATSVEKSSQKENEKEVGEEERGEGEGVIYLAQQ